jgi:protein required for attachment to host cells
MAVKKIAKLPSGAWVLVGDGRKALLLRNEGDERHPNLQARNVWQAPPNPATHEQGVDQAPRAIFGGRRSAIEQTDWHELAEHRFAEDVGDALAKVHRETPIQTLIVVAPPRALASLRAAFPDDLKRVVLAEIDKDLTKHPVHEIERHLTGR